MNSFLKKLILGCLLISSAQATENDHNQEFPELYKKSQWQQLSIDNLKEIVKIVSHDTINGDSHKKGYSRNIEMGDYICMYFARKLNNLTSIEDDAEIESLNRLVNKQENPPYIENSYSLHQNDKTFKFTLTFIKKEDLKNVTKEDSENNRHRTLLKKVSDSHRPPSGCLEKEYTEKLFSIEESLLKTRLEKENQDPITPPVSLHSDISGQPKETDIMDLYTKKEKKKLKNKINKKSKTEHQKLKFDTNKSSGNLPKMTELKKEIKKSTLRRQKSERKINKDKLI
jgi:hypothetical protein